MRLHRAATVSLALVLALPLSAAVLQVEGPQDSLDGPPLINHCTLRKAVINANTDTAAFPQCLAGSGLDTITFNFPMTVTFALSGIGEDAGFTGDLDVTHDLIIDGGGSIIDGNLLDRVFHILPGATVTIRN